MHVIFDSPKLGYCFVILFQFDSIFIKTHLGTSTDMEMFTTFHI